MPAHFVATTIRRRRYVCCCVVCVFVVCAKSTSSLERSISISRGSYVFRPSRACHFPFRDTFVCTSRGHTRRQRMPPETYRQRNITSGPRVIFPSYRSSGQSVSSSWHFNLTTLCVPSNSFGYNSVVLLGLIDAVLRRIYQYCFTIIRRL